MAKEVFLDFLGGICLFGLWGVFVLFLMIVSQGQMRTALCSGHKHSYGFLSRQKQSHDYLS